MALTPYSELRKGSRIIYNSQPYEIVEASAMFKARGSSVLQARLKNLITGNIIPQTFRGSDSFEEAELSKLKAKFVYSHKDKYVFSESDNSSKRFELSKDQIGDIAKFLKSNQEVEALIFNEEIINISLPVKISLKVSQAPPGTKGDRAQSGNKLVTLETGAEINAPLFIQQDDIIEINTEKSEYVRRIEKK
ncbi:elongation factor P [Patescibacteria group bacterium]|nr:elongation factor P [Patescibacteria group bacterium]